MPVSVVQLQCTEKYRYQYQRRLTLPTLGKKPQTYLHRAGPFRFQYTIDLIHIVVIKDSGCGGRIVILTLKRTGGNDGKSLPVALAQ